MVVNLVILIVLFSIACVIDGKDLIKSYNIKIIPLIMFSILIFIVGMYFGILITLIFEK